MNPAILGWLSCAVLLSLSAPSHAQCSAPGSWTASYGGQISINANLTGAMKYPNCSATAKLTVVLDGETGFTATAKYPGTDCKSATFTMTFAEDCKSASGTAVTAKGTVEDTWTSAAITCGDERDALIKEYADKKVNLKPYCQNFTQSAGSSNYSFSDFNTGDYGWALVRNPLTVATGDGLNSWVTAIGSAKPINSSFRNPARNAKVGGAAQSRHMYGDAVDLKNETRTEKEYNTVAAAAKVAGADYIEPLTGPCGKGCIHADWRTHPAGYAQ